MWIMHCSASNVKSQHHSEAGAREMLFAHVVGSKFFVDNFGWDEKFIQYPPCFAEHAIEDNGERCTYPGGCTIPYVRADGRRQSTV